MAFTRRRFLMTTAAGLAAAGLPGAGGARVLRRRSANEQVRLAVIGLNGRGRDLLGGFYKIPNVTIAALCDVDSDILAREEKALADRGGAGSEGTPKAFTTTDMRRIMDRKDIDAVVIATPNHWHSLAGVWACQAGKDAYVEKPVSHNVWEGRQLVNASRKYGRVVQAGTQARSSKAIAEAFEWMNAGNIGPIVVARGLCYKARKSIGKAEGEQAAPANIDYDLWTGPADMKPLGRKRLHYDWHWNFNTGNGDLGNQGIHQVDICRWALGERALAPTVQSVGGRFGYDDDGETPNTQLIWYGYKKAPLVFEVRGLPRNLAEQGGKWEMDKYRGSSIGVVIECEGGSLVITDQYGRVRAYDESGSKVIKEWTSSDDHSRNFIDAVRSRDAGSLAGDIEQGHISSALCHIGNISHRLGELSPRLENFRASGTGRDGVVREAYERFAAHLDANGIDLDSTQARLGPILTMDPKTERFTSNDAANGLLTRAYRGEFVVPELG